MPFVRKGGEIGGPKSSSSLGFNSGGLGLPQKKPAASVPPGCRPSVYNGQLLTSTGSDALDKLLGGGVPLGSLVLVEEDALTTHYETFLRLFLGQGVHLKNRLVVVTGETKASSLVESLPSLRQAGESSKDEEAEDEKAALAEDLKIAWRYQQYVEDRKVEESKRAASKAPGAHGQKSSQQISLAQAMDLSRPIDADTLKTNSCLLLDSDPENGLVAESVYSKMSAEVNASCNDPDPSKRITRIGVQSLGSMAWEGNLVSFLHKTRGLMRSSTRNDPLSAEMPQGGAVCMVTMPAYAFEDQVLLKKLEHICDLVVRVRSFASMDTDTMQTEFSEYQGFFDILKLPRVNTLVPVLPETLSYGFKLRSRGVKIEKLHLAPEGEGAASGGSVRSVPSEKKSAQQSTQKAVGSIDF